MIRVDLVNLSGRRLLGKPIRRAVEAALCSHGIEDGAVNVAVLGDEHMAAANRTYRGQDNATDVLTFANDPASRSATGVLGDILICRSFAERGAAARKVSASEEAAFLALHGALHLAGMEDESDDGRLAMQAEMNRIAPLAGLKPDSAWESQPYGS